MGRRLRSPPQGSDERHRFLRPGALARLRDSKIVARSLRSAASAASCARPLLPPCSPPRPATPSLSAEAGGVPHFFFGGSVARAPRYPLRKKLAAARGVVFLPPPPPMSPDAAADAFFGAFATAPSEMVAAH
ncbi:uncharacterized protein LOC104582110 [Brachypodium distachyon]|uniref:Uncharacterized protein n=1 Tax=Brachypodium distachyon TaxID=15368 RepID=A0A2K2DMD7_BRADI|nr:uncharacterized protein LOC104582110 [Brachypodium distachyon]PNT75441.1 hypothetical protein BRADI_1g32741v3 [Brachypodium distachyon]|eukprot:XP_010229747.1 uncharacterized protein LOC104582110 [Brachypodium distachyon]